MTRGKSLGDDGEALKITAKPWGWRQDAYRCSPKGGSIWYLSENSGKYPFEAEAIPLWCWRIPKGIWIDTQEHSKIQHLSEWVPLEYLKPFYCWKQYHLYIPLSVRDKHCAIGRGTNLYPVSLRDTFWGKIIGKVGYWCKVRAIFKLVESCKV